MLQLNADAARGSTPKRMRDSCGFLVSGGAAARRFVGRKLVTAMLLEVRWCWGALRGESVCDAGFPGPHRHAVVVRAARWESGGMLLSRLAIWRLQRALRRDSLLTSQDKLKVERIFAGHYPCEERDGYVWVYMSSSSRTASETSRGRIAADSEPGSRPPEAIPAAPALLFSVRNTRSPIFHASFHRKWIRESSG